MIRPKLISLIGIFISLLIVSFTFDKDNEKELRAKADSFFNKGEYLQAMPLYSQLLALNTKDAELNFKYGACLIYSDENTDEPIKYLSFAAKNNAPVESYYFLGLAYHLNYQFEDAIESYTNFLEQSDSKTKSKHKDASRKIEQCAYGSKLLSNIKDISVLDKIKTPATEFFRNYDLSDIGGRILVTPDELLSSNDKKYNHRSLIHFPGERSVIYFSSYGKEDNLDIYSARVLGNGEYSKPVKLSGQINTPYDENYPFLHPDGKSFYFSSKGHNSMGGYDIYKCDLSGDAVHSKPENLDFAINSPDDDILYIADSKKKMAFFASGRSSQQGDLHVYKVQVEAFPLNVAIIKGQFNSEISEDSHNASISVQDALNNKEIGTFYTRINDGEYIIVLPKAGRYKFYVEAPDSKYTHSGMVEIPPSNSIRAFKQTMDLVEVNEKEKLIIKNLFDQEIDDDVMALMQQVIKERAELNINSSEDDLDTDVVIDFQKIFQQAGFSADLNREGVEQRLNAREEELSAIVDSEKSIANDSKLLAGEMKNSSEDNLLKAEEYYALMNATTDPLQKEKYLIEAAKFKGASLEEADKAIVALEVGKFFEEESQVSESNLDQFRQKNNEIKSALDEENPVALELLREQKSLLDQKTSDTPDEKLNRIASEAQNSAEKLVQKATDLSDEFDALTRRVQSKKNALSNTKKEKDKIQIQNEIDVLQEELDLLEKDKNDAFEDLAKAQETASVMSGGRSIVQDMDSGEIEIDETVRENTDDLDKDIADIIVRNDNLEISEVEIQEILIRRPNLITEYFKDKKELAVFKNAYHLPDYITEEEESNFSDSASLDETTITDIDDSSTDSDTENNPAKEESNESVGNDDMVGLETDEVSVPEMDSSDIGMVNDPEGLSALLEDQFVAIDEIKEFLMPGYNSKVEDIEYGNYNEVQKANLKKELSQEMLDQIVYAKEDLNNDFDNSRITEDVFKKNLTFLENLELSENVTLSENINFINDSQSSSVTEGDVQEVESETEVSLATDESLSAIGVLESYTALDDRIEKVNELDISVSEKETKIADARKDFIAVLQDKIDQNKINIKYAPNEDIEQQLRNENDELGSLISEQQEKLSNSDISSQPNEFAESSLATVESSDNESTTSESNQEVIKEIEEWIGEAEKNPEIATQLQNPIEVRNYSNPQANLDFDNQNTLFEERDSLLLVNPELAQQKEIEIIEQSKSANRKEFDQLVYENSSDHPVETERAKDNMIKASSIRASAVQQGNSGEKARLLKIAYAYELNAIDQLNDLKSANTTESVSEVRTQAEIFEDEARALGINPIPELNDTDFNSIIEYNDDDIETILSSSSNYSDDEIVAIKNDPDQLAIAIKDWKASKIEEEIELQEIRAEDYSRNYTKKQAEIELIRSQIEEADDSQERVQLEQNLRKLEQEAEVLDFYQEIALKNADALAAKKNDIVNGQLLNVPSNEEAEYLALAEFVSKYYQDENALDGTIEDELTTNNSQETEVLSSTENEEGDRKLTNIDEVSTEELNDSELETEESSELNKETATEGNTVPENSNVEDEVGERVDDANLAENNSNTENEIDRTETENISTVSNAEESATSEMINESSEEINTTEDETLFTTESPIDAQDERADENVERTRDERDNLSTSVNGGNPNSVIEFDPVADRSTQLRIIADDGSESDYTLRDGDVVGLNNTINAKPFNASDEIPENLENELFYLGEDNVNAYDEEIPLDIGMPNGLIFQVQIGAFYKPVDPDVFAGFAPLNGQRSNSGLIRYRAGMFKIYDTANDAKNQIRAMGYDDAFVVAFLNGERIPLYKARNMLDEQTIDKYNYLARSEKANELASGTAINNLEPIPESNPIENIKGLFYTVQVGVYSRNIPHEALYNIMPLNSQKTNNQKIRYTSGVFTGFGEADVWKVDVRDIGISDAFVTAYMDGKRISLREANAILNDQGEIALADLNKISESFSMNEDALWMNFETHVVSKEDNISYRIRLGPYTKKVPMKEAHLILELKDEINYERNEYGDFFYTSMKSLNYAEAKAFINKYRNEEVTNIRIIAIKDGKEIDYNEAKRILEN